MSEPLHPAAVRTTAALRGRSAAPRTGLLGRQGCDVNQVVASFGTRRTPRPSLVCPRKRTCAGVVCCESVRRKVSAPRLLGSAFVRSSSCLHNRSFAEAMLADDDEFPMNPIKKTTHPNVWKVEFREVRMPVRSFLELNGFAHDLAPVRDLDGRVDTDPPIMCRASATRTSRSLHLVYRRRTAALFRTRLADRRTYLHPGTRQALPSP
jgi:hypothetical protein